MKNRSKLLKTLLYLSLSLVLLIMIGIGGFVIWAGNYSHAGINAILEMKSDNFVSVSETNDYILFLPNNPLKIDGKSTGYLFYPGGKVAAQAYSPILKAVSEAGYPTLIAKMPLNLAVFNINAADKIIAEFPDIRWVIGGHSLGGSMAAYYLYNKPDSLSGMILMGSYPAKSNNYRTAANQKLNSIPILSLFGNMDMGYLNILAYKELLPKSTEFIEIPGGNHAQFGDYGLQKGDGTATISPETQQNIAINAIIDFLSKIK
jgi:dienelactone hydrolase